MFFPPLKSYPSVDNHLPRFDSPSTISFQVYKQTSMDQEEEERDGRGGEGSGVHQVLVEIVGIE